MSVEIKNLCINVHVSAKNAPENGKANFAQWRTDVMEECKRLINEALERKRER